MFANMKPVMCASSTSIIATSCRMTHLSSGSLPYAESFLEPLLARLRWELRPVTEQLLETRNQHSYYIPNNLYV